MDYKRLFLEWGKYAACFHSWLRGRSPRIGSLKKHFWEPIQLPLIHNNSLNSLLNSNYLVRWLSLPCHTHRAKSSLGVQKGFWPSGYDNMRWTISISFSCTSCKQQWLRGVTQIQSMRWMPLIPEYTIAKSRRSLMSSSVNSQDKVNANAYHCRVRSEGNGW